MSCLVLDVLHGRVNVSIVVSHLRVRRHNFKGLDRSFDMELCPYVFPIFAIIIFLIMLSSVFSKVSRLVQVQVQVKRVQNLEPLSGGDAYFDFVMGICIWNEHICNFPYFCSKINLP